MIELLLSLPTWLGSIVAMLFATICGLLVYFISHRFISKYQQAALNDATSNLFRVVGMLVSLMLSLAFADVIVELRTIENAIQREAVAISDVFTALQMFDDEGTREIREIVVDYTQAVIDDDWPALADDRLGQRAGELGRQVRKQVIELSPAAPLQEQLWSAMIADLDAASDYRLIRLDNAMAHPPIYAYAVFLGFLVTMACFGTYRPQIPLVALATLYTLFIGLVLYLMLVLSDPFQSGIGVESDTFEQLVAILRAELE